MKTEIKSHLRSRAFFASFFAILFFAASAFAEKISFSARTMSGRAGSKEDTTELSGNASVITESIEVKADSIQLSGKEFRYVSASGKISGIHKESNLEFSADNLKYDRESKVVTLSGNVSLVDIDNDVKAAAQIIEYNSKTDIAVLQIDVRLEQKKNVCTSAYAVYQKKEQMLELNGNAKVVQDDDTFSAQAITFNMDTEEILMEGNVRGSVTDDGKKDSGEKNSKEKDSAQNPADENSAKENPSPQEKAADEKNGSAETQGENSSGENDE
ncbi:MAG: organic solvent tolerance protein OstA [Treponemataceae bacterium]|nr:organic solvent tolerance protein OstA [Treponemataceae bacterium]